MLMYAGDENLPDDVTSLTDPARIVYNAARHCFICDEPGTPDNPVTWIKLVRQWWCSICEEMLICE